MNVQEAIKQKRLRTKLVDLRSRNLKAKFLTLPLMKTRTTKTRRKEMTSDGEQRACMKRIPRMLLVTASRPKA